MVGFEVVVKVSTVCLKYALASGLLTNV